MGRTYQTTGELTDARHVKLDAPIPLVGGKVRVALEKLSVETASGLSDFESRLRQRQTARGHVARTKEEIDAYLHAERTSWNF